MPEAAGNGARRWRDDLRVVRALLSLAGPAALAAFVVLAAPPALDLAHQRLRNALKNVHESEEEALSRSWSPEYVAALAKVVAVVPPGAAYYVVPGDDWHGDLLVRSHLAPRRPVLLEKPLAVAPPPDAPRWVVVARANPPGPEVFETIEYFRREARR
ncbi:MAG TPA: hypothetical protein PK598_06855 [Thermoanaerobaculia bacterium]|nr:hypothetical protein [Thermoanaerobaculia bacterium]